MTSADLTYYATFCPGDGSEWLDWSIDIEGDEEEAYLKAKKLRLPFDDFPVLEAVLERATLEIAEEETQNLLDIDDSYVQECMGRYPVDPDEINALVDERVPHTLAYFELEDLSDEELDEWDANDLDDLPDVCDFQENFEPSNPFLTGGYSLSVFFSEHPDEDDLEEEEARETLTELFEEANGDYTVIHDYIDRCDYLYCGDDLTELAAEIADELGITDFQVEGGYNDDTILSRIIHILSCKSIPLEVL